MNHHDSFTSPRLERPVPAFLHRASPLSAAQKRQLQLQHDIIDLIFQRQLGQGDPLPTEQELIDELGVGRNSIREALKVLEALGIVEVRHGFGTFVGGNALTSMVRALGFRGQLALYHGGQEALELVEVREALEVGLLRSVIPVITQEQLSRVKEAYDAMEASVHQGTWLAEHDQRFHAAIFEPLGNELLSRLLDVFWQVYDTIAGVLDTVAPLDEGQTCTLLEAHRKLYEAISDKDADAATTLMREHFVGIRERLTSWQANWLAENKG
ncbi:FadR/GntR family transcriptional regulator [Rothia sp. SD9660Na]|uniref:FadR/GntR family transcriptional regulator n=1 Tax=Rothia sp. SD9660Na TaxID=3047030 RepID=UPI0024BB0DA0|nr:FadR/GntR family transcriptional regulator [Rothia sp. SD9660Na]WHS50715.1 FadR/GntR family transcriptional regulator [Rothia sp. SD9660Na]